MANGKVKIDITVDEKQALSKIKALSSTIEKSLGNLKIDTKAFDKISTGADKSATSAKKASDSWMKFGSAFEKAGSQSDKTGSSLESLGVSAEKAGSIMDKLGASGDDIGASLSASASESAKLGASIEAMASSTSSAGAVLSSLGAEAEASGASISQLASESSSAGSEMELAGVSADQVASALASAGSEADSAGSSASSAGSNFSKLSSGAEKATSSVKSLVGALGLMKAVSAGINLITGSVDSAISRFDTLNNSSLVFSNMGFSSKDTKAAMDSLNKSISGLPTPLDEAVQGMQLMATTTNGDIAKAEKVFSAVNNAVLGFGGSTADVNNAVLQLSQGFQNGKIDGMTWMSMMNSQMGPTLQAMATQMGITTDELKSGLSEGSISVEQFQEALIDLNENGGGGLESLSTIARDATGGISTSVANMKTAVTRGLANMIETFDELSTQITGLTIGENISAFGSAIEGALTKMAPFIAMVARWIDYTGAFENIGTAFKNVGKAIGEALDGINFNFKNVGIAIGNVINFISDIISSFANSGAIQAVATAFQKVGSAVVSVGEKIGITGESIGSTIGNIVEFIAKAIGAIADFVGGLNQQWTRALVAVGVGAVGIMSAFKIFDKLKSFNPFSFFKKNASDGMNGSASSVSKGAQIISSVFTGLGTVVSSIATGLATVISAMATGISTVLTGLATSISIAAQGIATAFSTMATGFASAMAIMGPANILALGAAISLVAISIGA